MRAGCDFNVQHVIIIIIIIIIAILVIHYMVDMTTLVSEIDILNTE